jgi:hypothetical protein
MVAYRAVLTLGPIFPAVLCGQIDPTALFQRARTVVVENIEKLPKHTCIQAVRRARFEATSGPGSSRCAHVDEAQGQPPMLAWTDQLKLDVTVSDGIELFSWAGARAFQSADAQEVVGNGMTSTGDFGRFLISIFRDGAAQVEFLSVEQDQGRAFAVYRYHVPTSTSRYTIRRSTRLDEQTTLAYEGKFWIDPKNAELKRLTIVVPQPPLEAQTCRIETTIDYQRVQIGGSRLLLPELTLLKLWDVDDSRLENRTTYAACRAFQSESVFRADAEDPAETKTSSVNDPAEGKAAVVIPRGLTLQIALRSRIDEESSFAGDAIEGELVHAIRARNGSALAPQGALVYGRIIRFERHFRPSNYFALGLKFDSLAVQGSAVPLTLELLTRSRGEKILNGPLERRKGIGMFLFQKDRVMLDHTFISEWKTTGLTPSE